MIIATAGHIDHGKTALVQALTGVDTDRLPEEKKRGMSIDLGFAYRPLGGEKIVGFVDVPGHERFIRNMLAGVTAIDYAMLIVAADDGPMPQTHEHLAILDLLGVRDGVVALTKIDRVDAARIGEVTEAIQNLIAGTCLDGADVLPVSAITGDGVEALREHLEAATELMGERETQGNFRLAIDRVFTVQGAGLVVTGAVFSGTVNAGDHLVLSPEGIRVRVRGIHAQNQASETGTVGQRCAINITGADVRRAEIHRGGWLLDERVHAPVPRFDARIRVLPSEARSLKHWTPVHVHVGAAEIPGRVAILEEKAIEPGEQALVQIVLDRRVGVLRGDGFILRDQSARRTMAGGNVIDIFPPARGRAKPERLRFLRAMSADDHADALQALIEQMPAGVDLKQFTTTWNLTPEDAELLWEAVELVRAGPEAAPIGFTPAHWEEICRQTTDGLRAWHEKNPDRAGPSLGVLRGLLDIRIPLPVFESVVASLVTEKRLINLGASYCLPGFEAKLAPKDAALWKKVKPILEDGHLMPPVVREISNQVDADPRALDKFLVRCAKLGMVRQVAKNRFLLPEAVIELGDVAAELAVRNGDAGFGAADFRDRTKIGRNLAIEILEYFDKSGLTWRKGDTRVLRKEVSEVFGERAD